MSVYGEHEHTTHTHTHTVYLYTWAYIDFHSVYDFWFSFRSPPTYCTWRRHWSLFPLPTTNCQHHSFMQRWGQRWFSKNTLSQCCKFGSLKTDTHWPKILRDTDTKPRCERGPCAPCWLYGWLLLLLFLETSMIPNCRQVFPVSACLHPVSYLWLSVPQCSYSNSTYPWFHDSLWHNVSSSCCTEAHPLGQWSGLKHTFQIGNKSLSLPMLAHNNFNRKTSLLAQSLTYFY